MLALTLDTAKNIAIAVVVLMIVLALISAKVTASIAKKARGGNQDPAIAGNFGVVGHMDEDVGGDFSALNEWHRPAP